jgi:GNAT superfamily N-acetyltransferase
MNWQEPVPLDFAHSVSEFDSGVETLNLWLKNRARNSEGRSARSYVVCTGKSAVVGYYCLSAHLVATEALPKRLGRNMPRKSPVFLLGRLAVDRSIQGKGLGLFLLRDAMLRSLAASMTIGARALMIEAKDEAVKPFYEGLGFVNFPPDSLSLFIPFETIAKSA